MSSSSLLPQTRFVAFYRGLYQPIEDFLVSMTSPSHTVCIISSLHYSPSYPFLPLSNTHRTLSLTQRHSNVQCTTYYMYMQKLYVCTLSLPPPILSLSLSHTHTQTNVEVIVLNLSWPAVSQICSFTFSPLTSIVRILKSTPIVVIYVPTHRRGEERERGRGREREDGGEHLKQLLFCHYSNRKLYHTCTCIPQCHNI